MGQSAIGSLIVRDVITFRTELRMCSSGLPAQFALTAPLQAKRISMKKLAEMTAQNVLMALLVCIGLAEFASAQSPMPLAHPNLDLMINGTVQAIVRQADGGVVFGGAFTAVNGAGRNNLARLLPNGTLDPDWNPGANGSISALAIDASGAVYVGGGFQQIGGLARSNLAKLSGSATGAVDPTWDPHANSVVSALAVDGTGAVFVGGAFQQIGGATRANIAKLSATGSGSADASWNPSANNTVNALAVDGAALYCGGMFTTAGGLPRQRIAKLSIAGTGAADPDWNPEINETFSIPMVLALALDGNGSILVGGIFDSAGGFSRSGLAKLSTAGVGSADATWNPLADPGSVYALLVEGSGSVYVGGYFANIGGQPRSGLAKLSSAGAGSADASWNPSPNSDVRALASDGSGGIFAGGIFSTMGSQQHLSLAAIHIDGSLGGATDVEGIPAVAAMVRQHNGGVIVSGNFISANGLPRTYFLRLTPDGTLDPGWAPLADGSAYALTVDSSDAVFAAGGFHRAGAYDRYGLAKFAGGGTGQVDPDWKPNLLFSPSVLGSAMAVDNNDRVYFGGWPETLVRFSNTGAGTIDPSWNPDVHDDVQAMVFDPASGALFVGGRLNFVGGQARSRLAKLPTVGPAVADPTWDPAPNNRVTALALDNQGALYVGGLFNSIGGLGRNNLAKVSTSGSGIIDPVWNPGMTALPFPAGPGWPVSALAVNSQGAILVSGQFTSVGGLPRNGLAKLSSDGAGAADASWDPQANGVATGVLVQPDDSIIVSGLFGAIGGQSREALAGFANPDLIFSDSFE